MSANNFIDLCRWATAAEQAKNKRRRRPKFRKHQGAA